MTEESGRVPDFLISFKESDRAWAEFIVKMLLDVGYTVDMQSWAYKASRAMLAEIERLGRDGVVFVPVLTPAYMTTLNSEHYWFEAFREGKFPVLPVWARECDIERLLFVHEFVDIRDCGFDKAREQILPLASKLKGPPRNSPAAARAALPRVTPGIRMAELAPVRRVPFERANPFTGGEALLDSLHTLLQSEGTAVLLPHESGLEGHGRRKACIEYLYRYETEYNLIWVVRASKPAVLAEDFAQLAHVIKLPEAGTRDLPYIVDAVRRWLNDNKGWLLLFHDPPSHNAILPYLPEPGRGHVLICTRRSAWPEARGVLHMTPWSPALVEQHLRSVLNGDYDPAVEPLLHGYPLAVTLAGNLARHCHWSAAVLTERLVARERALGEALKGKPPQRRAFAVALSLSLTWLWENNQGGIELLRALTYLDSYNILPGILVSGADALPGPLGKLLIDHVATEATIQCLRQMGLIEERFGSITIHGLVQAQLREWMEAPPRSPIHEVHPRFSQSRSFSLARAEGPLWVRRMVHLLLSIFPESSQFDRKARQASKLISHVYSVLDHATRLGVERGDCVELWSRLGEYLLYRELLDPARHALEQALSLDTLPQVGASERRYALYKALGQVCSYDNCPAEAAEHFEQALRLAERRFGQKHPRVSEMHILLGNALRKGGNTNGALAEYEKALEIDRALNAGPHEDTMRDLLLLGTIRHELGDHSSAWSHLEDATIMQQRVKGEGDISVAQVARCRARLNRDMGDLPQAQENLKLAMQVTQARMGPGHPALAADYMELGDLLWLGKDYSEARRAYKSAFKILQAVHGQDHLALVDCSIKLGDTALARQEAAKALPAYERAAAILRNQGNAQHRATAQLVEERLNAARAGCNQASA